MKCFPNIMCYKSLWFNAFIAHQDEKHICSKFLNYLIFGFSNFYGFELEKTTCVGHIEKAFHLIKTF